MVLQDFIGKVVMKAHNHERFVISELDGAGISIRSEKPGSHGCFSYYFYETGTASYNEAVSNGYLLFEDSTLTEPFKRIYNKYCCSEDGRWDRYIYWMNKG